MTEASESNSPEWVSDEEDEYVLSSTRAGVSVAATVRSTSPSPTERPSNSVFEQPKGGKATKSLGNTALQAVAAITDVQGPHVLLQQQQVVPVNGSAASARQQHLDSSGILGGSNEQRGSVTPQHLPPQPPPTGLPPPPVPTWHGLPPPPLPQRLPGIRPAAPRASSAESAHSSQAQPPSTAAGLAAPPLLAIRPALPGLPGRSRSSSGGGSVVQQCSDAAAVGPAVKQPPSPAAIQVALQGLQGLHPTAARAAQSADARQVPAPPAPPPGTLQQLQQAGTAELRKRPSADGHLPAPMAARPPPDYLQQRMQQLSSGAGLRRVSGDGSTAVTPAGAGAVQHASGLRQQQQQQHRQEADRVVMHEPQDVHAQTTTASQAAEDEQAAAIQHALQPLQPQQGQQQQQWPATVGIQSVDDSAAHAATEQHQGGVQHSSAAGMAAILSAQLDQRQPKHGSKGSSTEPAGQQSMSEDEDGWLQVAPVIVQPPPVSRSSATAAAVEAAVEQETSLLRHDLVPLVPAVAPPAMQPSVVTRTPSAQRQGADQAPADGSAATGTPAPTVAAAAAVVMMTAKAPVPVDASGPVSGGYIIAQHNPFAAGNGDGDDDFFAAVGSSTNLDHHHHQQQQQSWMPQPAASSSNNAALQQQMEPRGPEWGPPPPAAAVPASNDQIKSTTSSTGSTATPLTAAAAEGRVSGTQVPFALPQQLQHQAAPSIGMETEGVDFWDTLGAAGAAQIPGHSWQHPQQQQPPQPIAASHQQGQSQQAVMPTQDSATNPVSATANANTVPVAVTPEPFQSQALQQQQQQLYFIEQSVLPASAPLQHDVSLGTWATAGAGAAVGGASPSGAAAADLATEAQRALDMVPEEVDLAAAAAAAAVQRSDQSHQQPTALPTPAAGGAASAELQEVAVATIGVDAAHTAEEQQHQHTADDGQQDFQQGIAQHQRHWQLPQQHQDQRASAEQPQTGQQQQQQQLAAAPFKIISKPLFADDSDDGLSFFHSAASHIAMPDAVTVASVPAVVAAVPPAADPPPLIMAAAAAAETPAAAASPSFGFAVAAGPLFGAQDNSTAFFDEPSVQKPAVAAAAMPTVHSCDKPDAAAGPAVTAINWQQQQQQAGSIPWSHATGVGAELFGPDAASNDSLAFFAQGDDAKPADVASSKPPPQQQQQQQQQEQGQPWGHSVAWQQQSWQQQQHGVQDQQYSQHPFAGHQQQAPAAQAAHEYQQQHLDDATAFFDDADDGSAFFAVDSGPCGFAAQPFQQAAPSAFVGKSATQTAVTAASTHQEPPAAEAREAAAMLSAVQAKQPQPHVSAPTPAMSTAPPPSAIDHTSTAAASAATEQNQVLNSAVPYQYQQLDDGSSFFAAADHHDQQDVVQSHEVDGQPTPPSTAPAVAEQQPGVPVEQLQEHSAAARPDQTAAGLELPQQQQQQQSQEQQQPAVPGERLVNQQQQESQQQHAAEQLWGQDDDGQQCWHAEQQQHTLEQDHQQHAALHSQWGYNQHQQQQQQQPDWYEQQHQQQQQDWYGQQQQQQPELYGQQQHQQQQPELQRHQHDAAQQQQPWTLRYQQYDQQGSSQQWGQQHWNQSEQLQQQQWGSQQWNPQQQQQQQWGSNQPQQPWTPSGTAAAAAAAAADGTPDNAVGLNLSAQHQVAAQSMMGMTRSRYSTRLSAGSGGTAGGYLPAPGGFMPGPAAAAAAAAGMPLGGQAGPADSAAAAGVNKAAVASYIPHPAAPMHPPESSATVDLGMDATAAAGTGGYGLPPQNYSTVTSHIPQQQQQQRGWGTAAPYQPYTTGTVSWQYNQHSHAAAQSQGYAAAAVPSGYGQSAAPGAGYSQPVYDAAALAAYAAAAPPMTMLEGRRSPHGRPPCCFAVFGVGGRAVLQQPSVHSDMDINFATMGAGVLHITTLVQLPAVLKVSCPLSTSGTYPSLQHEQDPTAAAANKKQGSAGGATMATAAPVISLAAVNKLLDSFPGPLNPGSSRDKCTKFIKDRLANCQGDELPADAPAWQVDGRKALWDLLLLLANNQGQLKSSSGSSAGSKAAAAVGNLLKGAVGAAAAAAGDGTASPSAAAIAAGKAPSAADVGSPKAGSGDSELLRILAPGVAAGSAAAGQRLLATAVPEVELQATAAEMQRLLLLGRREDALGVALAGQLWAPALLLAHGCGENKFMEVSASMAQRGLIRGTPLRTLCLLLSNRPDLVHEGSLTQPALNTTTTPGGAGQAPLAVPAAGAGPVPPGGVLSPGALGLPGVRTTNPGMFNPGAGLNAGGSGGYTPGSGGGYRSSTVGFFTPGVVGGGDVLLCQWRENLAMMAANRTAADFEPIMQLGDRLLEEQQQVDAAHLCYVVAGCLPSTLDAGGRLTLLGVNQQTVAGRRALNQAIPLMRTEIYEWTRSLAGDAGQPWLAFLPYKLQLAGVLADQGQVARALQYCSVIDAAIRAVASKGGPASTGGIPPFLLVMTSQLESLRERLSVHAAVHNIRVNSNESALAKVGRFFDKAITNLMWGSDAAAGGPQPAVGRPLGAPPPPAAAGPGVVDTVGIEYQPPPAGMGVQGTGLVLGSEQYGVGGASWMQQSVSGPSSKGASPGAAAASNSNWAGAFRGTSIGAGYGVNSPSHAGVMAPRSSDARAAAAPLSGSGVMAGGPWGSSGSTVPSTEAWGVSGANSFTTGASSFPAGPPSSSGTSGVTAGVYGAPAAYVGGSTPHLGLNGSSHMPGYSALAGQSSGPDAAGPSGPASIPGFVSHHRNASQLSNMSGGSAHGQLAVSHGNMDSAHHSRNPSKDVLAATGAGLGPGTAPGAGPSGAPAGPPSAAAATGSNEGVSSSKQAVVVSSKSVDNQKRSTSDSGGGGGRGGWLTGVVSSVLGVKGPPVAKLGLENEFYFDDKRKRWVERGKEDAADDLMQPPPPPPTSFTPPAATTPAGSSSNLQHLAAAGAGSGPPSTSGPPPPPPPGAAAGGPPSSGPHSGSVSSAAGPAGSGPPSGAGGLYSSPKPHSLSSSGSFLKRSNAGISSRYVAAGGINTSSTLGVAGGNSSAGAGGTAMIPAAAGRGLGGLPPVGPPSAGPPSGFLVPAAAAAAHDAGGAGAADGAGHQPATAPPSEAAPEAKVADSAAARSGSHGTLQQLIQQQVGGQSSHQCAQQQQQQSAAPTSAPLVPAAAAVTSTPHNRTPSASSTTGAAPAVSPVAAPVITYDAYFPGRQQQQTGVAGVDTTGAAAASAVGHAGYGLASQQQHGYEQQYSQQQYLQQQYSQQPYSQQQYPQQSYGQQDFSQQQIYGLQQQHSQYGVPHQEQHFQQVGFSSTIAHQGYGYTMDGGANADAGHMHEVEL